MKTKYISIFVTVPNTKTAKKITAFLIKNNFNEIVKEVEKIHPYNVPEIVCVDISANKKYLNWIKEYAK